MLSSSGICAFRDRDLAAGGLLSFSRNVGRADVNTGKSSLKNKYRVGRDA